MKQLLTLFFLSTLFLLASCGEDQAVLDCASQNNEYVTYAFDEETASCYIVSEIDRDVCGNDIAEEGETFCNCPEDISQTLPLEEGGCNGDKGEFLSYACREDECVLEVTDKVTTSTKIVDMSAGSDVKLGASISYAYPFMIDRHNFDVRVSLDDFMNTENIKIKKVNIVKAFIVSSAGDQLGRADIRKEFKSKFDEIPFNVELSGFSFDTFNQEYRNVEFKLQGTYVKETYDNDGKLIKSEEKDFDFEERFETKLNLIDPNNTEGDLAQSSGGW